MHVPIILLVCLILPCTVRSQSFAPVGATWHYSEHFVLPPFGISFLKLNVTKDTVIAGKPSVELNIEELCGHASGLHYLHVSHDSVYFFDPEFDQFKLIYAFDALPGQFWTIPLKDYDNDIDTMIVHIDSISTIVINDQMLRLQYVTIFGKDYNHGELEYQWAYNDSLIERIGNFHFPIYFPLNFSIACDVSWSDGLRCYEDELIGFYHVPEEPDCEFTYVDVHELQVLPLKLFPNPTSDEITIDSDFKSPLVVQVLDLHGKICKTFTEKNNISLTGLSTGIYFLKVVDEGGKIYLTKVIKS